MDESTVVVIQASMQVATTTWQVEQITYDLNTSTPRAVVP